SILFALYDNILAVLVLHNYKITLCVKALYRTVGNKVAYGDLLLQRFNLIGEIEVFLVVGLELNSVLSALFTAQLDLIVDICKLFGYDLDLLLGVVVLLG
ncbi:MAG: hypothetical protein IKL46_00835, partial [Clostridia bacterium]|nr:hypothetical protein [Alphaproteobacteria bacterium]MBR3591379.1 hypothetical protein [Clostridia bacterium]